MANVIKKARRQRMRMAWSIWVVSAIYVLFQFYLQLSSGELVSALMHTFALTAFGGGLLVSAYYYVYVFLQTPAGVLMDRFGPRIVLSAGAFVVCLGCFLFGLAHFVSVAIIGRILMGAGAAFAFVGCLNLISRWFPIRKFALMASIVETVGIVGAINGNLWLARFIDRAGWRICILVTGGIAFLFGILLLLIVRNSPRKKIALVQKNSTHALWLGVKELIKNRLAWLNGFYSGLMFSIVNVFAALWAIPFLEKLHHVNLLHATIVTTLLYIGIAIGCPVVGLIDSYWNCRRSLMILCALLSSLLLFIIIFWVQLSLWTVSILLFFSGVFASSYILTCAVANEIALPNYRATSLGFMNMLCVGLTPILQPFIGFLISHFKGNIIVWHFEWAMSIIPFLLLFAAISAVFLPNRE